MPGEHDDSLAEAFTSGSIVFGLVSAFTCWWFPYGAIIGILGALFGVLGWWSGKEGDRTLAGIIIAATGGGASLLLAWDYWWRVF